MNFRILLGTVALLFCAAYGCQKSDVLPSKNITFIQKRFYPENEDIAKSKVEHFLQFSRENKIGTSRTTYPNTEINEGRWILTGAANFEKNQNDNVEGKYSKESYSISVLNLVEDNILKMDGSEMTNSYAAFINLINSDENLFGTLAVMIEMEITNVTNYETSISVTVLYKKDETLQENLISWNAAAKKIEKGIPNGNEIYGAMPWTPDPKFSGTPPLTFATNRSGIDTDINNLDYTEIPWLSIDIVDATSILLNFINANQSSYASPNPNQPYASLPWLYASGAQIDAKSPGPGVIERHYLTSFFVAQYIYFY